MNPTRTLLTTLTGAALAISLAACGGSSAGSATSTSSAVGAAGSATDAPKPASPAGTGAGPSMMGSDVASMPGMSSPAGPSMSGMAGMATKFNDQDVTFAADMIGHHRQAVQMAKLAAGRTTTAAVLALAKQIEAAQAPEITMMSGWLTGWGKPVPEDMGGMDMGGSMPGMMSAAAMAKLTAAKGTAFDKQFLTMMISHHQGAITMAKTQLAKGSSPEAVALAKKVIKDQTAQIHTMQMMLR